MPLETQASEISLSLSKGVDVNKIEKELASMWSGVSEGGAASSNAGVTRACALNLIVYTTPWDDRSRLEDLLDQVNEQHPGRTLILVAYRDTATSRLEGYVSMRCRRLGGTGKQICGEQVSIEAGGLAVETAATAVAPLLVPDVPVYLWWKDIPHYEDKLFDRLAQMADRIVIDSAAFDHPYDDLLRLNKMISDRSRMRVSDLNWGRLTSWRTLLASFWDVPAYRPLLDEIDSVAIKSFSPKDAPDEVAPKALLLAGWLASRLGWELVGKASHRTEGVAECELRAGDRSIALAFVQDKTAGRNEGMISTVTLSANNGAAKFSVAKRTDGTKLETEAQIGSERSVGRVLSYEIRSEAAQLSRELAFLSRDAIYEAAVAQVAQLVQTIRNHKTTPQ
ncbi:MAG: glucose-6-phosphate dehydrogenase assembly protein OpcA [Acidobacteriota bacterium]|nr:glucose-6-phosphate dehydrogenase assembly protein OpcA [Acidobacteriota bacterium]